MQDAKKCKRCLLRDAFPEDYQKYVAGLLRRMRPGEKAGEALYAQRLACCQNCDQLQNGTCMGCGCLVELRAARRDERCPFRKW